MTTVKDKKLLYHLTDIDNLGSILSNGLLSRKKLIDSGEKFVDTANKEILEKREGEEFPLSEFVPFHFFSRNPYDYAIFNKQDIDNLVYITIYRDKVQNEAFIVPEHPVSKNKPKIYPYKEGFNLIKWDIIEADDRDYADPDTRRICMAECIVRDSVPPEFFARLYVGSEPAEARVRALVDASKFSDLKIDLNSYMFKPPSDSQR